MLRALAIGTLVCTCVCTIARADVYRWVDEKGGVHYSDQWVPGSELIKLSRPRPNSSSSAPDSAKQQTAVAADRASAQLKEEATQRVVKQDVAKTHEQQCKDAKDRYEKVIQARKIFKSDKAGEREYMSDQDVDAVRVKAHTDMEEACAPSK